MKDFRLIFKKINYSSFDNLSYKQFTKLEITVIKVECTTQPLYDGF